MRRSNDPRRKRPETGPPGLVDVDRRILAIIKNNGSLGVFLGDIKAETKLTDNVVRKSLKTLVAKELVREVVNIHNKGKKHFIAIEFEPSKEITGGVWYVDGKLDKELISIIQKLCLIHMRTQKVSTLQGVYEQVKRKNVLNFDLTSQQVAEVLNSMVLENVIIEVKSTGLGDYHLIPIGATCYRVASAGGVARGSKDGAFASIPCGVCPRISVCTPDGIISPTTCVYYTKWLDIEF